MNEREGYEVFRVAEQLQEQINPEQDSSATLAESGLEDEHEACNCYCDDCRDGLHCERSKCRNG